MAAITAFNIAQFAYMVKKMHSLREGDGTLLDNCIMMWGSGLEDGNKHTRENLPFIIAGKGGGSIQTGRFLPDTKGNQGDLLTTLLACAGIPTGPPDWDRDEATRGNQGLARNPPPRVTEPHPAGADGFENLAWVRLVAGHREERRRKFLVD